MLNVLRKMIALDNPVRILYHNVRAVIANVRYWFPSKDMTIIWVTGTNGKTTTCNMIANGLKASGKKIFMFTTVNIMIGDEQATNTTKMTSPDPFLLQRLLLDAKKAGCEIAIIETASHGIKYNRIWWIHYDMCVLTNITQDHLDLHKTMKDYVNTKLKIFQKLITYNRKPGVKKTAVINAESDYAELFLNETYDSMYIYGQSNKANLTPSDITNTIDGTKFTVKVPGKDMQIETSFRWDFNVYNITAAIGVFMAFGMKPQEIEKAIKEMPGIPGRMEEVSNKYGYKIFIDYAHTADALDKVLSTLRATENIGKIITVFGATGDRDRSKRPIMWEVISRLSDVFILTQDDDYTEKTVDIIKDVLPGVERKEWEDFWIIPDRQEAIRTAIMAAESGDAILIAGKWDEHVLMTNDGAMQWHDKTEVLKMLKEIEENEIVK